MDRRIEIVDQLRADRGLSQHKINGRSRVSRVAIEHRKECVIFFGRLEALRLHMPG